MVTTFPDVKAHLTSEHTEQTNIVHLKLDRTNVDKVTCPTVSNDYFTMNQEHGLLRILPQEESITGTQPHVKEAQLTGI